MISARAGNIAEAVYEGDTIMKELALFTNRYFFTDGSIFDK